MNLIYDTHAHYDDHAFDEDREDVLSGLLSKGVGCVINASAAVRKIPAVLNLAQTHDFVYAMAGLHPCETYGCGDNMGDPVMEAEQEADPAEMKLTADPILQLNSAVAGYDSAQMLTHVTIPDVADDLNRILSEYDIRERIDADWRAADREERLLRAALVQPKVVAVGEIGLDYHYDDTRKEVQKDWFARQIALAREYHLPINVHSRDAAQDTLDLIKAEHAGETGGIIHCFSYSKEMAGAFLDQGFMLGIGGVITYKNGKKLKEVAGYMPMDRMVLETDCPYLAPAPFRGKRNDSSLLHYAAEAVGQIKALTKEQVIELTAQNARRLYRIP